MFDAYRNCCFIRRPRIEDSSKRQHSSVVYIPYHVNFFFSCRGNHAVRAIFVNVNNISFEYNISSSVEYKISLNTRGSELSHHKKKIEKTRIKGSLNGSKELGDASLFK